MSLMANMRESFMSKTRGIALGITIWCLAFLVFIFNLLPLVGSTSHSSTGIYLVEYVWDRNEEIWLRLGYYGLCLVDSYHNSLCQTTTGRSGEDLAKNWNLRSNYVPVFNYILELQHSVFVGFLTAGGVVWLVSLILITLVILRGHFGERVVRNMVVVRKMTLIRKMAVMTSLVAAILMVASAWATNSAAKALELAGHGHGTAVKGGSALSGLQWVGAILAFVYAYAVSAVVHAEDGAVVEKAHEAEVTA